MSEQLHYNFYRKELWQGRFFSVDDSNNSNFNLLRTVLPTVGGLTTEKFQHLIEQAQAENNIDLWHLTDWSAKLERLLSTSPNESWESSIDTDFEAIQLLNLYTLVHRLYHFNEMNLNQLIQKTVSMSEQAHALPPAYAVRECLRHVVEDIEIMQRAILQRRRENDSAGNYIMSSLAKTLLVTDKLVYMALAPFAHLLPNDPNPITFLSQNTYIHHVPYSQKIILIGIRNDCIEFELNKTSRSPKEILPAFELMAIPHEVGHYVYRHTEQNDIKIFLKLSQRFIDEAHPYHHWCEEIFSDVYSCIIAGPLAVLGMQALLAFGDDHHLEQDDGTHPSPILRPFILSRILQTLSQKHPHYQFAESTFNLNENWAMILPQRGCIVHGSAGDGDCTIESPDAPAIHVAEELHKLQPIIEIFVDVLLDVANPTLLANVETEILPPHIPWCRQDEGELRNYDPVMSALTTYQFAAQTKVPNQNLNELERINLESTDSFHQLLSKWGDSGPLTIGGHGLRANTLNDNEVQNIYTSKSSSTIPKEALAALFQMYPTFQDFKGKNVTINNKNGTWVVERTLT